MNYGQKYTIERENISIFDFQLTREKMNAIDALNRDEKHDWY